jgi:hypothetical protein
MACVCEVIEPQAQPDLAVRTATSVDCLREEIGTSYGVMAIL